MISPATITITGSGDAAKDEQSRQSAEQLTTRDAASANGSLTNTLTLQQAQALQTEVARQRENMEAAKLVGAVLSNMVGDLAKDKWPDGSPQKIALHGMVGLIEAKIGGGSAAAGALAGMTHEALVPAMTTYLNSLGFDESTPAKKQEFDALMNAGSCLLGAAVGTLASGDVKGASTGASVALIADINNRQLHANEVQRIRELANGDPKKQADLTAAACAMAHCADGVPRDDPGYAYLKALQDYGQTLTAEQSLLGSQKGWEGRTYGPLFGYDNIVDTAFDWAAQNKMGARIAGAVQGGVGIAGVVGSGVACTSGFGCALGAASGSVSADYAQAGIRQAITGNYEVTQGELVLQSLGLSPQAASIAYAVLGLAPASAEAVAANKAVDAQAAANAWARGTYNGTSSIAYEGAVYRYTKTEWAEGTFQIYSGNVKADFRYSPSGVGGVYAGTTPKTAAAEVSSYAKVDESPLAGKVLVSGNVSINNVLDLTNPAARQALGVTLDDITQVGHGGAAYATPQRLSKWARDQGYKGILAPSAQNPRGANLVTFDSMPIVSGGRR